MKSKGVAYLLWFFFGCLGIHRFYCGKVLTGLIWLFTLGLFGFGWFLDLFLTSGMVDVANARMMGRMGANQNVMQNVVVNVQHPLPVAEPVQK